MHVFGLWKKAETKLESTHTGTRRACKNRQRPKLASGLETRIFSARGDDDTEPLLTNILYSHQSICLHCKVLWVSSIFTPYALWSQHDMLLRIHMISIALFCFVFYPAKLPFAFWSSDQYEKAQSCVFQCLATLVCRQLFSKPWVSDIIL